MNFYDFSTIRKYIIVFSKLFTDINLQYLDTDNTVLRNIQVPIIYGSKKKTYYSINSNLESAGAKLPLMSMKLIDMQYDSDRQRNTMYGHESLSKVSSNLKKYIDNPAPYNFIFELSIWTKKTSDMHKILQQVLPMFKPKIVKNVNILPEINLSLETPIRFTGMTNDTEDEYNEEPDSVKVCMYTLNFELSGYLFDPIKDIKIVKEIQLRTENDKYRLTDQYNYDDVINKNLTTLTDYDMETVKTFSITASEDKQKYNYFLDISTEISSYGEKFIIEDSSGNEYPFVYEYDNGEYYGNDSLVPEYLALVKTGYICILLGEMDSGDIKTLHMKVADNNNYEFASDVINLYIDFNRNVLRDVHIQNKTVNDYVYNNQGTLKIKTVDGSCKIFTNDSIKDSDKYFEIGFTSTSFENSKYICGMHSEVTDNYMYLKADASTQVVEVHEVVIGNDTELATIACGSTISTISFDFTSDDLEIDIDGTTYSFTPANEYIIPYINWNGSVVASVDYVLGYRK